MGLSDLFYRLKFFYGSELYEHLKGWDDNMMDYNSSYYRFQLILLWTFGICFVVFVLYYYIINHPRLNRWGHWLCSLILVAVLTGAWGYYVVDYDISNANISPSLANSISRANAISFGIYNAVLASLIYFMGTVTCRHKSKNCKHTPWKSFNR